jgi:hypothetical protein
MPKLITIISNISSQHPHFIFVASKQFKDHVLKLNQNGF